MIKTLEGLKSTREALAILESIMRNYESERAKYHPKTYDVLTEPIAEDIAKFRAEIAEFESRRPNLPPTATDSAPVSEVA
jgi:hypothetical protein